VRPTPLLLVFLLSLLWAVSPAGAQEGRFAFQIRGGGTVPLGDFRAEDRGWEGKTGSGPSFGMGFHIPLKGLLGAYLGFSQHRFGCQEEVCHRGKDWVSTGFDVGLRWVLGRHRIRPWFLVALHAPRVEGRLVEEGERVKRTSEGAGGLEAGGGIMIRIGEGTSLQPGVRYGRVDLPFPDQDPLELRYLVVDLGLVMSF